MSLSNYRDQIIVALDVQKDEDFIRLTESLKGHATYVKIGMELFYTKGPDAIKVLKEMGFKVFLDLKLHDIPNTVLKSVKTLVKLGVDIINVHAGGGLEMMKAAKVGRDQGMEEYGITQKPLLIAVTQLTSTNQNILEQDLLIKQEISEVVKSYAMKAKEAGLDGVVSSALDVELIKEACGKEFITVTPGIRPKGSSTDDQKRVMTPTEAINIGSDYLVIGRAITNSDNPGGALEKIIEEI
jgi:orotidine-5'-phosphate decarboxylase